MTTSPTLALTLMTASQSQKEVLFNELLLAFDTLFRGVVISSTLATPPSSPTEGDCYIVGASPTGAWSGQTLNIAFYFNGWQFVTAKNQMRLYDEGSSVWRVFHSSSSTWDAEPVSVVTVLDDLTNVEGTPTDGQVLTYRTSDSHWKPQTPITSLAGLTDVSVTESSGINGYTLNWNNSTGKWQAVAPLASGGPSYLGIDTQTASYTLALSDANKFVSMNVATANTVTVPANATVAFPIDTVIGIEQLGVGTTSLVAASGVTIRSLGGALSLAGQYAVANLIKIASDTWQLVLSGTASAGTLAGLSDVSVSTGSGVDGYVVYWNNGASKFELKAAGGGTLATLTDVNVTEGAGIDGQYLKWNNTTSKWIASTVTGGSSTLAADTDVNISSPANGQALLYNSGTGKWTNSSVLATPSSATAPTIVQSSTNASNTAMSFTMGSTPTNGNLLVAILMVYPTSYTIGTGWTVVGSGTATTGDGYVIATKVAGASESTTQTPLAVAGAGAIYEISGFKSSGPFNSFVGNINNAAATTLAQSIWVPQDHSVVVGIFASAGGSSSAPTLSGSGYTSDSTATATGSTAGGPRTVASFHDSVTIAGSTSITATWGSSGNADCIYVSLAPVVVGVNTLAGLLDVNVTEGSGIDGKVLTWQNSSSTWIASTPSSGGSSTLAADTDVSIAIPATGQVLTFNGTAWQNQNPVVSSSLLPPFYEHGAFAPPSPSWFTTESGSGVTGTVTSVANVGTTFTVSGATSSLPNTLFKRSISGWGSTWALTVRLVNDVILGSYPGAGLFVEDSAGKVYTLRIEYQGTASLPALMWQRWNSVNSYSANQQRDQITEVPKWMRLRLASGTLYYGYSMDGITWMEGSESATAFLGSTLSYAGVLHNGYSNDTSFGSANGGALVTYWDDPDYPASGHETLTSATLTSLSDVSVVEGAGIDGYVLKYHNATGKWIASSAGSGTGSATLAGDSDVAITSPTNNQYLAWNTVAGYWINQSAPMNIAVSITGLMVNAEIMLQYVFPYAASFPSGLTGSYAKANTAATASTTVTIKKNGASVGTLAWAASGTSGTFTFSTATSFAAGDVLQLVAPSTADATLADIGITLAGTRT